MTMQCYVLPFFVDAIMFSHNGANMPESKTSMFHRVCQVVAPGAKLLSVIADLFPYVAGFLKKFVDRVL